MAFLGSAFGMAAGSAAVGGITGTLGFLWDIATSRFTLAAAAAGIALCAMANPKAAKAALSAFEKSPPKDLQGALKSSFTVASTIVKEGWRPAYNMVRKSVGSLAEETAKITKAGEAGPVLET
ncbi:MAG: hypothetical protein IT558_05525 [Alphaproteobacteria bacterium]|nr:hypothetical protein [Alphaproteobacteria bacterium]